MDRRFWQAKAAEGTAPSAANPDSDSASASAATDPHADARPLSWIPVSLTLGRGGDDGLHVDERLMTTHGEIRQASACRPRPPPGTVASVAADVRVEEDTTEGCTERRTYEIFAAVFHIRDAKSCGSLVAAIKVRKKQGPGHDRQETQLRLREPGSDAHKSKGPDANGKKYSCDLHKRKGPDASERTGLSTTRNAKAPSLNPKQRECVEERNTAAPRKAKSRARPWQQHQKS